MNTLTNHLTELDNQIGFQERNRLGTQERTAAINEALFIIYGLLQGSPIIRSNTTISVDSSSIGTPPTDFNEGVVLYMGDASTFDGSNPVYEVDAAKFGRLDTGDYDFFTQNYAANGDAQFEFNSISSATLYIEYEKGAPTLSGGSDDDGLPKGALYIVAKLAAGILSQNLLSDEVKLQTYLYGPSGNPSKYTPTSIMGMLSNLSNKRKARAKKGRITRIKLN